MITITKSNNRIVEVDGIAYEIFEEDDIQKGDVCYDIIIEQIYISQDDYPRSLPGLTGRRVEELNPSNYTDF